MVRSWLLITSHTSISYQCVNQLLPKALLPAFLLFVSDHRPGMNGMDTWYQADRTEPNIMYWYLLHEDMHCLVYSLMYWTMRSIQWLNKRVNIFRFVLSLQPLAKSLSCTRLSAMVLVPQCCVITFSFGSYLFPGLFTTQVFAWNAHVILGCNTCSSTLPQEYILSVCWCYEKTTNQTGFDIFAAAIKFSSWLWWTCMLH